MFCGVAPEASRATIIKLLLFLIFYNLLQQFGSLLEPGGNAIGTGFAG
jgi:hypothetical protein